MDSHGLSLFWPSLPGTDMSKINFLTAGVIKLLSNAEITFSQEGATDLPKKYLVPRLCTLMDQSIGPPTSSPGRAGWGLAP